MSPVRRGPSLAWRGVRLLLLQLYTELYSTPTALYFVFAAAVAFESERTIALYVLLSPCLAEFKIVLVPPFPLARALPFPEAFPSQWPLLEQRLQPFRPHFALPRPPPLPASKPPRPHHSAARP